MGLSPKRLSRLSAIALLVLALALTWQVVVAPLLDRFTGVREQIATERMLLGRLQAAREELARQRPEDADATSTPALHLPGASEAIALASLQASVTSVAARHGLRLLTSRMLPVIERDEMRLAGMQVEIAAPIEQVQQVIHAIESARPVLFIDQLTLEPRPVLARAPGEEDAQLRLAMQVYGVLRPSRPGGQE